MQSCKKGQYKHVTANITSELEVIRGQSNVPDVLGSGEGIVVGRMHDSSIVEENTELACFHGMLKLYAAEKRQSKKAV